jgi:zinc transporter, ZIP family
LPTDPVWIAFSLTLFAGMATGLGSAIAFFARRTDYRFLGVAMGFSAGVMLYVSFMEILVKAESATSETYGPAIGPWVTLASFLAGIGLIALVDALVPKGRNPHEPRAEPELQQLNPGRAHDHPEVEPGTLQGPLRVGRGGGRSPAHDPHLMRTGLFAALAIGIHNFPEGLATFLAALEDPRLGLALAIAVGLHNIPEGISVSVPIYYATGSRARAFFYSAMSGLAEPVGAVLGYVMLRTFFTTDIMGVLFGGIAGVMVYISLDELLPAARQYGSEHNVLFGIVSGMAVMGISLVLLR